MATSDVIKPDHASARRHFIFTDEHEQLRESIHRFVVAELQPHAEEWEQTTFPDSVFGRMGELGFLGLDKPEQYGGQGGDYYTSLVLAEELAYAHSGGLVMGVAVHTDMAMPPILAFGTEEQKQQWVVPAIQGQKILCLGITEPDAGSDVAGIKTRAVHDPDAGEYVINGSKTYITNGHRADAIVLVTKTDVNMSPPPTPNTHDGFTLFLVPMD
ncbi:MAG: acyl-CoA dehydrogenase family protein, partial [Solirubrobacteraceae bacterium]